MGPRLADVYNAPMQMDQWEQGGVPWRALGGRLLGAVAAPAAARLINTVAVVGLAALLAHWTRGALWPAARSGPMRSATPRPPRPSLAVLLNAHLFGRPATEGPAAIPVSRLPLIVSGLVTGRPGVALIGRPGQGVRPYQVGATVSAGVVLEAVTFGRAILRQDGRLEGLLLYPPKAAPSPPSALPGGSGPRRPPGVFGSRRVRHPIAISAGPSVAAGLGGISSASLGSWLVSDPQGGVLVRGVPGPVFADLGLRQGDVIERVDGYPVNSLDSVVRAYMGGARNGAVTVDVRRHGRTEVFRYGVRGP